MGDASFGLVASRSLSEGQIIREASDRTSGNISPVYLSRYERPALHRIWYLRELLNDVAFTQNYPFHALLRDVKYFTTRENLISDPAFQRMDSPDH